jgi:hypothetical protein
MVCVNIGQDGYRRRQQQQRAVRFICFDNDVFAFAEFGV